MSLSSFLPAYEPGGEVHGLNGVRIRRQIDHGLVVLPTEVGDGVHGVVILK